MKLRQRIIVLFSSTFLVVLGMALLGVYSLSAQYRSQEFLERLKDKTTTTFRLLFEVEQIDHDLLRVFDDNIINSLYEEKVLLFDSNGKLIYSSVDDTRVLFPEDVVQRLKNGEEEITYTEGEFDVYAHVIHEKGQEYFAIGKAYDRYGKDKLEFLMWVLIVIFFASVILVSFLVFYITRQLTRPILQLTTEVEQITATNLRKVEVPPTHDEITSLALGFNAMLDRVDESFRFQKNLIHHISHELKTPIAVLMTNIERSMNQTDPALQRESMEFQRSGLMQMAGVINTLLEISKYESLPERVFEGEVRLLDVIFECTDEFKLLDQDVLIDFQLDENVQDAGELTLPGSERMLKIAFINLLRNAIEYSTDKQVKVELNLNQSTVDIAISNNGEVLTQEEQLKLFGHFFRGNNSRKKAGIGLGLVMTARIIELHQGKVNYAISANQLNFFHVQLKRHR
jgi:signal transduction histidine kinase